MKPRIGLNRFDSESVTNEGVAGTKKWERIESYGPKFVENIVQAISKDILWHAMKILSHCMICNHVHAELIIECREERHRLMLSASRWEEHRPRQRG